MLEKYDAGEGPMLVRKDFLNSNGDNQDIIYCEEVQYYDVYRIKNLVSKGYKPDVVVDLGAQIGTFSYLSKKYWPDARLISVEPVPEQLRVLRLNVPTAEVCPAALIGFLKEKRDDLYNTDNVYEQMFRKGRCDVKGISVADFIKKYELTKIDFMKMDIEGSEVNVLKEFAELGWLDKIGMIHGEWHRADGFGEVMNILNKYFYINGRMAIGKGGSVGGDFYASSEERYITCVE